MGRLTSTQMVAATAELDDLVEQIDVTEITDALADAARSVGLATAHRPSA